MIFNTTLEGLQTDEQRRVLDIITQVRKCGLDSILSLPQIVVCGDQSAGKSSVLEALTEIPFPRNDNLCTRFATEISLRRESRDRITVKVIPDADRSANDQEKIKSFSKSITDFKQLPAIMKAAMKVMGISDNSKISGSAFASDTLSIEIDGPSKPQLTLVDIPGLIQASTKGVSPDDVAMVAKITDRYISQHRTICLAVISATNDAANQPILERVRKFDPKGDRTLGVITKPDMLPAGSGSEAKFLELARNEDVYFKLGWHVIKNRKFEERDFSFKARNDSETEYFLTSNFKSLPKDTVGIETLRARLSQLLFGHVKTELPRLKEELDSALEKAKAELCGLGNSRTNAAECRAYLTQLGMNCYELCKAGVQGNYHDAFFRTDSNGPFTPETITTTTRLRAVVQYFNAKFAAQVAITGQKYILMIDESKPVSSSKSGQKPMTREQSLAWVRSKLLRSRGTELLGNFNPHLISELFWEQSEPWESLAKNHVEQISKICEKFLFNLLERKAPRDVKSRVWSLMVRDVLPQRQQAALEELSKLIQEKNDIPINYNHYYTDEISDRRQQRLRVMLENNVNVFITNTTPERCNRGDHYTKPSIDHSIRKALDNCSKHTTPDMEKFSCEEALDCLHAIYKVQQKTFVANITTQVIERHIVRGLDSIFSPMVVVNMSDTEVQAVVSEPEAVKRQRISLADRIEKLETGNKSFQGVMSFSS